MSLSCLVIEDSPSHLEHVVKVLRDHFTQIDDIQTASNVEQVQAKLGQQSFDLILSDIHLEDRLVFEAFQNFPQLKSKLIFISSHGEHALEAFKFSAINFILKPYEDQELIAEVSKTLELINQNNYHKQLEVLMHNLTAPQEARRLVLKNHDLIHIVDLNEILFAKAENNYTHFFCESRNMLVSKPLKHYENQLASSKFFRCHQSYLVRLDKVKAFHKSEDAIILQNDTSIPVSSSKKKLLYQLIA